MCPLRARDAARDAVQSARAPPERAGAGGADQPPPFGGHRRRTYLRLVPAPLDSLTRPGAQAARRVLFVCTANSARSHLAAALWRRVGTMPAASAGTHPGAAIDPGAIAAAGRHQLPFAVYTLATSMTSSRTGNLWSRCATWRARNSAGWRRCTGGSPPGPGRQPGQLRRGPGQPGAAGRAPRPPPRDPPASAGACQAGGVVLPAGRAGRCAGRAGRTRGSRDRSDEGFGSFRQPAGPATRTGQRLTRAARSSAGGRCRCGERCARGGGSREG